MLKRYQNVVISGNGNVNFDFGNSFQNDESVIFTFKHNFNYAPNTRLSLYNYDVEIIMNGFAMSGHPSDNYLDFIIPRYAYCQLMLPASMIDTNYISVLNNHTASLNMYWGFSTVKGFIKPRINVGWIGYLENIIEFNIIDFLTNSISRYSLKVIHIKNTDTSTSVNLWTKSRDNSGATYTTLNTFTASGVYTTVDQLQVNPYRLMMTTNGNTSSDWVMASIELLVN